MVLAAGMPPAAVWAGSASGCGKAVIISVALCLMLGGKTILPGNFFFASV